MWRATDINDVCEGGSAVPPKAMLEAQGLPLDRFAPVCSAVRGAIGMSLVTVCTHPVPAAAVPELTQVLSHIILTDKNVTTVGYMMDALRRLSKHGNAEVARTRSALQQHRHTTVGKSLCRIHA